ncbi:MAG: bifunctional phosphopantothenoylcysteine decarboxylase/phosphopantothenate--cysteine ligase CoaBC [Ignavibacteria bacterium]
MTDLKNKKIILGVSGGIAAYKSCYLVRELVKLNAEVRVVMTPSACEFVTPLTFSTLSQNEVIVNIFPDKRENTKTSTWHIHLAQWADLIVIAPATVNTIAKINHGIADNALTTLVSARRCPLLIVPAADEDMYLSFQNQKNIAELKLQGVHFIEAEFGELASGLTGLGRMAEVDLIVEKIKSLLSNSKKDFRKKKILVTSGPTYEPIDPVRFIGNRSSGKMGHAIALASLYRGADVTVISGPTNLTYPSSIKVINVKTAEEMLKAVKKEFPNCDILISAAAVADYRPIKISRSKIKKSESPLIIELEENRDILQEISRIKKKNQIVVGFSVETENEIENSKAKLDKKKLDMIVINNPLEEGAGFEVDTNQIYILKKDGSLKKYPKKFKFDVANDILDEIKNL